MSIFVPHAFQSNIAARFLIVAHSAKSPRTKEWEEK